MEDHESDEAANALAALAAGEEPTPSAGLVGMPSPAFPTAVRRPAGPSLTGRRTMIPILLTTGVLLIVFSSLKAVMGPDSPFAGYGNGLLAAAAGAGVLLLIVALINMLSVRAAMKIAFRH